MTSTSCPSSDICNMDPSLPFSLAWRSISSSSSHVEMLYNFSFSFSLSLSRKDDFFKSCFFLLLNHCADDEEVEGFKICKRSLSERLGFICFCLIKIGSAYSFCIDVVVCTIFGDDDDVVVVVVVKQPESEPQSSFCVDFVLICIFLAYGDFNVCTEFL